MTRRIRPELQSGLSDCGAACVAMILRYFRAPRPIAEVADESGVGRDGTTALSLVRTARAFGLEVHAYGLSAAQLRSCAARFPGVAHWRSNHFVVVESVSGTTVRIIDPAVGRLRLTHKEFDESYSGVYLEFSQGTARSARPPAPTPSPWILARIGAALRRNRARLLVLIVLSLLVHIAGIGVPLLSGVLIDRVIPHRDTMLLYGVLGLIVGGLLAYLLVSWYRQQVILRLHQCLDREFTEAIVSHLMRLPLSFFLRRGTSDIVQRVGSISSIREMLGTQAIAALFDGPLLVTYLVVVGVRSWSIGLALLGCIAAQMILIALGGPWMVRSGQRELMSRAAADGRLIETISAIETVKASGAEEAVRAGWLELFEQALGRSASSARAESTVHNASTALQLVAPAVLIWIGATEVLSGHLSLGQMIATTTLGIAALAPAGSLAGTVQRVHIARAHTGRLRELVNAAPERAGTGAPAPRLTGRIALEGVSFRYSRDSPWVLRGIDLEIPAGSTVALVGRSGSGKSTLARMILGLFTPTEGRVTYDGIDADDLDITSVRRQFGVVTQHSELFTGTIFSNIQLGQRESGLAAVVRAAAVAEIDADIAQMPMGYETMLREGDGLSGGQRQRVALARAVRADPAVLLLDEATSALDSATEARIVANLSGLSHTRIIIAHRLSTIRSADLILVVDEGRIVERGTHEDLLALGGTYAQMVLASAGGRAVPAVPAVPAAQGVRSR